MRSNGSHDTCDNDMILLKSRDYVPLLLVQFVTNYRQSNEDENASRNPNEITLLLSIFISSHSKQFSRFPKFPRIFYTIYYRPVQSLSLLIYNFKHLTFRIFVSSSKIL